MKTVLKKLAILTIFLAGISLAYAQGDADLMLKPSVSEASKDGEFTVDVVLKNPGQQNVISVRSWLNYDPAILEALNVDSSASSFTLSAPGEDTISAGEGRVKIGRSNITGGVNDIETTVVTVRFRVLGAYEGNTTISFYDYQVSELGHTSINIIDQGFPVNILGEEPESIQMKLNPGAGYEPAPLPEPEPTPTPEPEPTLTPTPGIGGEPFAYDLMRPTNLMVNTGAGYVDLKWNAFFDSARIGFNIYYGKNSGQYTRRRSVGNVNSYRLNDLINNETYYFAITAYDQFNRESDYSNEVGVIVNQPLSSTHPFATLLSQTLGRLPLQPQNGPLVGWLIFSAAGLGGAIVYGRRKRLAEVINLKSLI